MRLRDMRPADALKGLSWAADHLLGFQYQNKRLKLDGMTPAVKRLTIAGLVTIVLLMVCLVHAAALHMARSTCSMAGASTSPFQRSRYA